MGSLGPRAQACRKARVDVVTPLMSPLTCFRPRLKNVDRSTAQQLAVTVGNVTVIITDFKEKTRSSSTSSSTVTSSAGSEQQNQSSSGSESTDKGSSRSSTPKGDMSAVNDESFWNCTWNCETMNQGMRFKPSTCPCCLLPGESSVDDLVVMLPGEVLLAVGIWLPRNFVPWQLLLTLLCIPLFYMIFLTIIYNWMCSWIYFLYKKKSAVHNFPCTLQLVFCFCFVEEGWEGGGNFYLLCSQTPSCQHILLNLVFFQLYSVLSVLI